jgi:hypothetical protein
VIVRLGDLFQFNRNRHGRDQSSPSCGPRAAALLELKG